MNIGRFLAGIAALVWYPPTNEYLLLRRSAEKDFADGVWECVTGRVDQGEGFEEALHREVWEEIGVKVKIAFFVGTTHFFRGESKPENELVGVIFACIIEDPDAIQISQEHDVYRWVTAVQAHTLLTTDDPATQWTRRVIDRAEMIRQAIPAALLDLNQRNGFELG